jgi:hypothetical protein
MLRVVREMGSVGRHAPVARARTILALCALLGALAAPAAALVHMGDPAGNTTPPVDDPGFANLGALSNGLGAIYLGNGWVLTAGHAGGGAVTFGGVTYPYVNGSWTVMMHAPGVQADLAMQRITGNPPLDPLVIAWDDPLPGETVVMIGRGWVRQPSQTCWDSGWAEVPCSPGPVAYRGFKQWIGQPRVARWGQNDVLDTGIVVPIGGSTTQAFEVEFEDPGVATEAQAVHGDSGGAVFVKRGSQWQLVGVMFTISLYMGQPPSTVVFGDRTYSVDLTHYRNQILFHMRGVQVPALPWPALPLVAGALAGVGRVALSDRRRDRTPARRG